ncbi:uncharacterized protein LOC119085546 [Bradysia coprophila]|uniref:uncharacterized protein LOC119085546 n=1 Tax=Bradysia coprophila TaxID=38358 RepID=UPI00187DCFD4|nr:uncharacterized protein LOC119085546 [Bradysia coprophila]
MSKPKKVMDMRKAGNAAMEKEKYEKAIQLYTDALLIRNISLEDKGVLRSNRSHAYFMSALKKPDNNEDKLQSALQDADEVINIRPTWWKGYFRAGLVYKHRQEWDKAIECFEEALSLNRKLADVKDYRDECRFDKIQAESGGNVMSHGFKAEIDKTNALQKNRSKLQVELIIKNYEKLLKSKEPRMRALGCVFFGVRYVKGVDVPQNPAKGIALLEEAVEAGSPEAMVELGIFYMLGKGVVRSIRQAVRLFEKAANSDPRHQNLLGGECDGIAYAQFHIGLCYENGTGKPSDYQQACSWYEEASARGHAGAANNLAVLYSEALGGEKCLTRANKYFKLAANRGNCMAMESLAWKYLWERDVEQAESWYLLSLESGNQHSIQNKDKFYKALENVRIFVRDLAASSSFDVANVNPDDLANLFNAVERITCDKKTIAKIESLAGATVSRYWGDYEKIKRRAETGYPFAKTVLTSMCYFAESSHCFSQLFSRKMTAAEVKFIKEKVIYNLANCLRASEIIAYLQPWKIPLLFEICEGMVAGQNSSLDLVARIVYCYLLSLSNNSEFPRFSRICLRMYPDEVFFYKIQAVFFALRQNFEDSLEVCDQGLERFPMDECLLYCRAGAMKFIETISIESVVEAYKDFIEYAPFDESLIPEANYVIAYHASDEDERELYYNKGFEAELHMLPCLLPYQSRWKTLMDAFNAMGIDDNGGVPNSMASAAPRNPKLSDTKRTQCVLRHRETLKIISERMEGNLVDQLTFTPQHKQKVSECPDNIREITLQDMHPQRNVVYKERYINLVICEDPMFGLLSAVHVVVRDDNFDFINCSFYDLRHNDKTVRQSLAFGTKITIVNPYHRVAVDGNVSLRVHEQNMIIYRGNGKDNPICRYCFKENPEHACGGCRRVKYCSRNCQSDDWKDLNHKAICGLKYFDWL